MKNLRARDKDKIAEAFRAGMSIDEIVRQSFVVGTPYRSVTNEDVEAVIREFVRPGRRGMTKLPETVDLSFKHGDPVRPWWGPARWHTLPPRRLAPDRDRAEGWGSGYSWPDGRSPQGRAGAVGGGGRSALGSTASGGRKEQTHPTSRRSAPPTGSRYRGRRNE